jgi:hypothetical protein
MRFESGLGVIVVHANQRLTPAAPAIRPHSGLDGFVEMTRLLTSYEEIVP